MLFGITLLPIINLNVERLAEQKGWDQLLSVRWDGALTVVSEIATQSWFHVLLGVALGASFFMWIDYFLRGREAIVTPVSESVPQVASIDVSAELSEPNGATTELSEPNGATTELSYVDVSDDYPNRIFVEEDITAKYLTDLCRNVTSIDAEKSIAPYKGKWLSISGYICDITEYSDNSMMVSIFITKSFPDPYFSVNAEFDDEKYYWKIKTMNMNDTISVCGIISNIQAHNIRLEKSEIIA